MPQNNSSTETHEIAGALVGGSGDLASKVAKYPNWDYTVFITLVTKSHEIAGALQRGVEGLGVDRDP